MSEASKYDLSRILPNIPHLAERQAVAAALAKFDEVSGRESEATRDVRAKITEIRDKLNDKHRAELEAATKDLTAEEAAIRKKFETEFEMVDDYPGIDGPWQMHDDHLGCYCCEITGLPLRDDDDVIEWGDGEALKAAVEAALLVK